MSLNKKVLAAAIVGGLFAGSAHAAVDISAPASAPSPAVRIAAESVVPANGLVVANTGNALDLVSRLGYSFSNGEVRYARVECSDNMEFTSGAVALSGAGTPGAINGLNTNAIYFSITATGATLTADSTLTINGARTVDSKDNVSCTYGLYDEPSQAQAGGTNGRIATFTGNYLTFAQSYDIVTTPGTSIADVEANPSFSLFDTDELYTSIGAFRYGLVGNLGTTPARTTPIDPADGVAVTLTDMMGTGTALVFTGDFSAAANATGNAWTGEALNRVFIAPTAAGCDSFTAGTDFAANSLSATTARFTVNNNSRSGVLCLVSRGGGYAIPASDYTVALDAVATGTAFVATDIAAKDLGSIERNGTELQAPLAQIPNDWFSRVVLTNTSGTARSYSINVLTEEGVTVTTGTLTGMVPANGTKVIENVREIFTGANRATLVVNVAGPDKSIQGLYQIVNPSQGSISNHVMVRPGTN
ncbi:hypothetical protein E5843_03510 [Luteimonas yindakuii]|uniref:hypothetical protein n=1 Tax=Luteimonas yindakuii TaxID=2565782 RepID=UPI0010A3486F|nr:hypothetical protein [Luteimonas yindakuii]QCO67079.1 hypothetical protein E5843_03510 [Luteimonas yindakuii]